MNAYYTCREVYEYGAVMPSTLGAGDLIGKVDKNERRIIVLEEKVFGDKTFRRRGVIPVAGKP